MDTLAGLGYGVVDDEASECLGYMGRGHEEGDGKHGARFEDSAEFRPPPKFRVLRLRVSSTQTSTRRVRCAVYPHPVLSDATQGRIASKLTQDLMTLALDGPSVGFPCISVPPISADPFHELGMRKQ